VSKQCADSPLDLASELHVLHTNFWKYVKVAICFLMFFLVLLLYLWAYQHVGSGLGQKVGGPLTNDTLLSFSFFLFPFSFFLSSFFFLLSSFFFLLSSFFFLLFFFCSFFFFSFFFFLSSFFFLLFSFFFFLSSFFFLLFSFFFFLSSFFFFLSSFFFLLLSIHFVKNHTDASLLYDGWCVHCSQDYLGSHRRFSDYYCYAYFWILG
jgi:hypothetical protein